MEDKNEKEEIDKDKDENATNKQIADLKDKWMRSIAESDNIRKRAEKEKDEVRKYSIFAFAKDILTVRDNLKLALASCDNNEGDQLVVIKKGIEMTLIEIDKILEKYGISIINPLNSPFDPTYHQAMFETVDDSKTSGTVIEIIQDGFMIMDRLLRPALVGVSTSKKSA